MDTALLIAVGLGGIVLGWLLKWSFSNERTLKAELRQARLYEQELIDKMKCSDCVHYTDGATSEECLSCLFTPKEKWEHR